MSKGRGIYFPLVAFVYGLLARLRARLRIRRAASAGYIDETGICPYSEPALIRAWMRGRRRAKEDSIMAWE